jgi:hypothetical protein
MKNIYVLFVIQFLCFGLMAQNPVMPMGDGSEASPYKIGNLENLYWITVNPQHWDKTFVQTANIDASETRNWFDGKGWIPIGISFYENFSGNYDGKGYVISRLFINRTEMNYVGLFGYVRSSDWNDIKRIKNLGIIDADITGQYYVSALCGMNSVYIIDCYSSGKLKGKADTGGLVGLNRGRIENSSSTVLVLGEESTGGLAGANVNGSILNCYAKSNVKGNGMTGGLVGYNYDASITRSFFQGNVLGTVMVGGLAGVIRDYSPIKECFSTGLVSGENRVGGLVGISFGAEASITNTYSRSDVIGMSNIGGLIGEIAEFGSIMFSYSAGKVTGSLYTGGLVGQKQVDEQIDPAQFNISNYWDTKTSGWKTSAMGQGRTTAQMTVPFANNTYVGWDFQKIWKADARINDGYPYLSWQKFDEDFIACAMGQGYWFARPHTRWPFEVVIGNHTFSQKEAQKKFWPANTNTKRAFTQYASIYLSGTTISHFPVLEEYMKVIEHYFTHYYPAPAGKDVNKAASDIGKWIDRNSCEKIKTISEMIVAESVALKVYPNPFRDQINFEFTPEENTQVSVVLYNLIGERVLVPVKGSVNALETFRFSINTETLPAGIYIYRLETATQLYQDKVILTR